MAHDYQISATIPITIAHSSPVGQDYQLVNMIDGIGVGAQDISVPPTTVFNLEPLEFLMTESTPGDHDFVLEIRRYLSEVPGMEGETEVVYTTDPVPFNIPAPVDTVVQLNGAITITVTPVFE